MSSSFTSSSWTFWAWFAVRTRQKRYQQCHTSCWRIYKIAVQCSRIRRFLNCLCGAAAWIRSDFLSKCSDELRCLLCLSRLHKHERKHLFDFFCFSSAFLIFFNFLKELMCHVLLSLSINQSAQTFAVWYYISLVLHWSYESKVGNR